MAETVTASSRHTQDDFSWDGLHRAEEISSNMDFWFDLTAIQWTNVSQFTSQSATPAAYAVVEALSASSVSGDDLAAELVTAASEIHFGSDPLSTTAFPAGGHDVLFVAIDSAASAQGGKPGGGGGGGSGGGGPGGGSNGGGGGSSGSYFAGSGDGEAGFDIWIEFRGTGWTVELQQAFQDAADYFTTVITEDIGGGANYRGKYVDDLYITAELASIDGSGGVLGQAGPVALWSATELTAAGQMQFDVADANNFFNLGLWDDIVTHELMHVLGFGSLWNYGDNPLVSGDQYLGEAGLTAYQNLFETATYIPVETDGGSGTAGSHWDNDALGHELMTGYIDGNNYLSEFSVMSLADLGYTVQYQAWTNTVAAA